MKKECKICKYFWNILISIDQFVNTLLGGSPDETISSRSAKRIEDQLWARIICKFLDIFEKDHCKKSLEEDEGHNNVIK